MVHGEHLNLTTLLWVICSQEAVIHSHNLAHTHTHADVQPGTSGWTLCQI